jgi:hypothetical protein
VLALRLPERSECCSQLSGEELWLFPGREVTTLGGKTVTAAGIEMSTALKLLALLSQ